jgi:cytidylate kinase
MAKKQRYEELYCITEEDVFNVAEDMAIQKEKITPEVMRKVRQALDEGLDGWAYIVEGALSEVLGKEGIE